MQTMMAIQGGGVVVNRWAGTWTIAAECDLSLAPRTCTRSRRAAMYRMAADAVEAFPDFTVGVVEAGTRTIAVTVEVCQEEDFARVAAFFTGRMFA